MRRVGAAHNGVSCRARQAVAVCVAAPKPAKVLFYGAQGHLFGRAQTASRVYAKSRGWRNVYHDKARRFVSFIVLLFKQLRNIRHGIRLWLVWSTKVEGGARHSANLLSARHINSNVTETKADFTEGVPLRRILFMRSTPARY